jgi:hypothetical protein
MLMIGVLIDGDTHATFPVALFTTTEDYGDLVVPTRAGPVALLPAAVFLDQVPPECVIRLLDRHPATCLEHQGLWHPSKVTSLHIV